MLRLRLNGNVDGTLLTDCSRLIIPVVNVLFDGNYGLDDKVNLFQNESFITAGSDEKRSPQQSLIQIIQALTFRNREYCIFIRLRIQKNIPLQLLHQTERNYHTRFR